MNTDVIVNTSDMACYKRRSNFFSKDINAIVKIESKSGKISIDNGQRKFIQKEYAPVSIFKWGFNGKCYIKSQPVTRDIKPHLREVPFFDL
jgi:hypothetical protein